MKSENNRAINKKFTIEFLDKDNFSDWDNFVEKSPQGTIFSSTLWLNVLGKSFKIFCCYKNNELVGGVAFFVKKNGFLKQIYIPRLTPFQGILFQDNSSINYQERVTIERDISLSIINELIKNYSRIFISNHFTLQDSYPFDRNGFLKRFEHTYIVDISDLEKAWERLEKRTRYEVNKAKKNKLVVTQEDNILSFDRLHRSTFRRQKRFCPISTNFLVNLYKNLKRAGGGQLYFARNENKELSAAALIIWDNKRAYYLMAASNPKLRGDGGPSLILWSAFDHLSKRGFKEIDLVGANTPSITKFKRGFGGQLRPYFIFSRNKYPFFDIYDLAKNNLKQWIKDKIWSQR